MSLHGDSTLSGSPWRKPPNKYPPTTAALVDHGATRNPVPKRCAVVFTACRQYQPRANPTPNFDASWQNSSNKSPTIDSSSGTVNRLTSQVAKLGGRTKFAWES